MEELLKLLPDEYAPPIVTRLCYDKLTEVRVVNGGPVRVRYGASNYYLCPTGITRDVRLAFAADQREAERIVLRACERSLYTVTDTLRRGYISVRGGIRIGVCGSGVVSGGQVSALKDYSSAVIRVPHEVKGCADGLYARVVAGGIKNTLIVSPPGGGKTTLLRDLCRLLSDGGRNVLLCDEKYELAASVGGVATLDVGACTDVLSGTDKAHAFSAGIASMRPDVIMADELFEGDLMAVRRAATSGVAVIATVHARSAADILAKPEWSAAIGDGVFCLFAFISELADRAVTVREGLT